MEDIFNIYEKVKNEPLNSIKHNVQNSFNNLILNNKTETIKKFLLECVSLELLMYHDSKMQNDHSFYSVIYESHHIELIEYIFTLPKYKEENKHMSVSLNIFSSNIKNGFIWSASGNNVDLLKAYEKIHLHNVIEATNPHKFGLNESIGQYVNIEGKRVLKLDHYVFRHALQMATQSDYENTDIIEYIMEKSQVYNATKCYPTVYELMNVLNESKSFYEKANCLYKYLKYDSESEIFIQAYDSTKLQIDDMEKIKDNPIFSYLILEKYIPYTPEIKEAIKDDPYMQNLFLFNKLNKNTQAKEYNSNKSKL